MACDFKVCLNRKMIFTCHMNKKLAINKPFCRLASERVSGWVSGWVGVWVDGLV